MFWTLKPDELNPSLYVITATSDLLRNGLLEKKKKTTQEFIPKHTPA